MVWQTKKMRSLELEARRRLSFGHGRRDRSEAQECADSLLKLARDHLLEDAVETVKTGDGEDRVSAIDRVIHTVVPCSLNGERWCGFADVAAELIVNLCDLAPAIRDHYQSNETKVICNTIRYWTDRSSDKDAQDRVMHKLFSLESGPLKLPGNALSRGYVVDPIYRDPAAFGVDVNGLASNEYQKRQLLSEIALQGQSYLSGLAVGASALSQESDTRVQYWLDNKPDLEWIWKPSPANSGDFYLKPALELAQQSKAFCRWVIERALDKARESDFPALAINRLSPANAPLLHYAISHEMTDLVERLIDAGADPLWTIHIYTPLGSGLCGTYRHLGGNLMDWYGRKSGARELYEKSAPPSMDLIVDRWPQDWGRAEFVVPVGASGLKGRLYPMGDEAWELTLTTLLAMGLANVERTDEGFSVSLRDSLREKLGAVVERPACRG